MKPLRLCGASLDEDNVPVLDNVVLAFGHDLTLCFDCRLVAFFLQDCIVVYNNLDERLLKVAVNDSRGLRCLGAIPECPLSHLVCARCEEAAEVETLTHRCDDLGKRRLGAELLALFLYFGVVLESRKALLETYGYGNDGIASRVFLDPFGDLGQMLVLLSDVVLLAKVDEVDHRFGGEEEQRVDDLDLNSSVSTSIRPGVQTKGILKCCRSEGISSQDVSCVGETFEELGLFELEALVHHKKGVAIRREESGYNIPLLGPSHLSARPCQP